MECTCEGWRVGSPQVNAAWMNSVIHHGAQYDGPHYEYCPWCGNALTKGRWTTCCLCDEDFVRKEGASRTCDVCVGEVAAMALNPVPPQWLGVKADGITDDTTAIQASINQYRDE